MNRVLVIGATGNVGRQVVSQLAAAGAKVRALARNPDTAALPSHVEVVRGDLTLPESLDACLDGVDAVFLVWLAPPAAVAPALERILKQARRIVFLSSPYKTPHPFFQAGQPNPTASMQAEIERLIENSGREWTFLRPGMFASNTVVWWAPLVRSGAKVVRWPYIAAPTAPIHERDIAAVAVRALCEEGHAGSEYLLTGPQTLTQSEQIAIVGDVIRRPLRLEEISPDEARTELLSTYPAYILNYLLKAWDAAIGRPAFMTSTIEQITGVPARSFRNWATDHAADFRSPLA
uniref:NmrA family protein n=1 Tax=Solibacter usitatus (strain Ellin6076) TaxID=234267 RepID=Q01UX0_SOLUE